MRKISLTELDVLRQTDYSYNPFIFARCLEYGTNLHLCKVILISIPTKKIKLQNFITTGFMSFTDQQNKPLLIIDSEQELLDIIKRQKFGNNPSIPRTETDSKIAQLNLHLETYYY